MKPLTIIAVTMASGAVRTSPASAEIVKAPTGESSKLALSASIKQTLKKHGVSVSSTGSARKVGSTVSMPYSLSRWDFAAREGDVVHFKKNTGLRFRRAGGRSVAMVHPRVILDGGDGYVSALISDARLKVFTFKRSSGKVTNTARRQRISSLKLRLTKAAAGALNKGLGRHVLRAFAQFGTLELNILTRPASQTLSGGAKGSTGSGGTSITLSSAPGQGTNPGATLHAGTGVLSALPVGGALAPAAPAVSVALDGDGQAEAGIFALPLKMTTFSATTKTGTIALDGGLIVRATGRMSWRSTTRRSSSARTPTRAGLYALVNGARVKVGDVDLNALKVNVLDETVTVSDLDVPGQASPPR